MSNEYPIYAKLETISDLGSCGQSWHINTETYAAGGVLYHIHFSSHSFPGSIP